MPVKSPSVAGMTSRPSQTPLTRRTTIDTMLPPTKCPTSIPRDRLDAAGRAGTCGAAAAAAWSSAVGILSDWLFMRQKGAQDSDKEAFNSRIWSKSTGRASSSRCRAHQAVVTRA